MSGTTSDSQTGARWEIVRIVRNEEVPRIYEGYDESALELLLECLKHNVHWPARLLAAMYASSGFATRQALVSSFDSSKTAISFLLNTKSYRMTIPVVYRRALYADIRVNKWRVSSLTGVSKHTCLKFLSVQHCLHKQFETITGRGMSQQLRHRLPVICLRFTRTLQCYQMLHKCSWR